MFGPANDALPGMLVSRPQRVRAPCPEPSRRRSARPLPRPRPSRSPSYGAFWSYRQPPDADQPQRARLIFLFVLDERARQVDDLPRGNLVTALIGFENSRSPEALGRAMSALSEWLRGPEEAELKRAFLQWVLQVAAPARFRPEDLSAMLPQLEEGRTMLAEWAKEWYEEAHERGVQQGIQQGIERGLERGRAEERVLLCRLASRKFGAETGERLSGLLARLTDPERLVEVGGWIMECRTSADLLDRTGRLTRLS